MGRIIVRGSINIDEFFTVPHIVKLGETLSSTRYSKRGGGKGANQAVSCARAGADVDFVGAIGQDGQWLADTLRGYGVGVEALKTLEDETPTGRALIQLETSTGENSIVLIQGANYSSAVTLPSLSSSMYSHLLLQSEIPHTSTLEALHAAHEAGVSTIWNPSPLPDQKTLKHFPWNELDWIIMNEGEAAALYEALGGEREDRGDELEKCKGLKELEDVNIIVTKGARGVAGVLKGSKSKVVKVPAGTVVGGVKDTTGAGDCFTGYLGAGLAEAGNVLTDDVLEGILKNGTIAAAMCVSREGAMESVPTREEVSKRLKE